MPLTPCHQLVKDLKATIDARLTGRQVSTFAHRGRSIGYADTPLRELINYYNQMRACCPDALADPELIAIGDLDQPTGTRGAPGVRLGRAWV